MPTMRAKAACERPKALRRELMRMPIGARILPPLFVNTLTEIGARWNKHLQNVAAIPVLY
jgi:hypothetical protein